MKESFEQAMSQVITIKKRTLWILLVVFLAIAGCTLFWYIKKRKEVGEIRLKLEKEWKNLYDETRNCAMREHIKHVDRGEKYCKNCNMCNGNWK